MSPWDLLGLDVSIFTYWIISPFQKSNFEDEFDGDQSYLNYRERHFGPLQIWFPLVTPGSSEDEKGSWEESQENQRDGYSPAAGKLETQEDQMFIFASEDWEKLILLCEGC